MQQEFVLPKRKKRNFLNENFNPLNKEDVRHVLSLLSTDIPFDFKSAADWYGLFHEASCAISEAHTILELKLSLHVSDLKLENDLHNFEEHILSQLLSIRSELMDIYISSPWRNAMHLYDNDRIINDIKIRRNYTCSEISKLQIEENQLIREYKRFSHTAKTSFEGKSTLVSVVVGKLNDNDSRVRKLAFMSYWEFMKTNEEKYQDLFDSLIINRRKQAECVRARDYIDIAFAELGRFDYGRSECDLFRDSIYQEVIPVINSLSISQKKSLKTDQIFPWDISFWPELMPEKMPAKGNVKDLYTAIQNIVSKIHPSFGMLFNEMTKNNLIDIFPKHGKAPGAFCATFQECGYPYVFANFGGTFRDAITFIHEFGHAIHGYAVSNINNILLRHPGFEFCEVASIGLELLASPFFSELWSDKNDSSKALSFQLFHMLNFWPFMAMIDEWQHQIYSAKDFLSSNQRNEIWRTISKKYRPQVDWSGLEDFESLGWMSRPHVFTSPFYYIDYGIAQSGALQLWKKSKENYAEAVRNYISGLSLGAQKSLQGLYEATGIKFDFNRDIMKNLCTEIQNEIKNVCKI